MRHPHVRVAVMASSCLLAACGGGSAMRGADTPKVSEHGDAPQACQAAKDPLNPMIVEWPAMSRSDLDTASRRGIVVVSYAGCVMKVLTNCMAEGSYELTPSTPVGDTLTIEDESKLYAELPLGVASLKGELSQGKKQELSYVAVGQRASAKAPAALSGDCRGATHWVKSMTVGAYALDTMASTKAGAGAGVMNVSAGGEDASKRARKSGAGDVEGCRGGSASGESCNAILKLGLAELAPAGAASAGFGAGLGPVSSVPVIQPLQEFAGPAGGLSDVDVALLQLLQTAKRADKDNSLAAEKRAAAWEALEGYPGKNPYKASAEERKAAWLRVAEAEAKRREQVAKVCAEHQKDKAKLDQLLGMDNDVVPAQQKEAYRKEFARAYDPWKQDIEGCVQAAARQAEEVRRAEVARQQAAAREAENAKIAAGRCGSGRYSVLDQGTGGDTDDGSGLVRDTRTGLTWMRKPYSGSGLTQEVSAGYCRSKGMRLPTKDEALGIAAGNREPCAFPRGWWTWTSNPAGSGRAWVVDFHGNTFEFGVGRNYDVVCVR